MKKIIVFIYFASLTPLLFASEITQEISEGKEEIQEPIATESQSKKRKRIETEQEIESQLEKQIKKPSVESAITPAQQTQLLTPTLTESEIGREKGLALETKQPNIFIKLLEVINNTNSKFEMLMAKKNIPLAGKEHLPQLYEMVNDEIFKTYIIPGINNSKNISNNVLINKKVFHFDKKESSQKAHRAKSIYLFSADQQDENKNVPIYTLTIDVSPPFGYLHYFSDTQTRGVYVKLQNWQDETIFETRSAGYELNNPPQAYHASIRLILEGNDLSRSQVYIKSK